MAVSYGSFNFPSPQPIISINDEPIYVAGELDSSLTKISVIGMITGANLSGISYAKKLLISGLLNEYQTLIIEGRSFPYSKPINISFSESDLTTILPYSVEFDSQDEKSFSKYYGVINPTNIWTYQEQEGRVIQASHTVSAKGAKTSPSTSLEAAINFVNSNITGFQNFSIINPSGYSFLQSKSEEVDRFLSSYSVTENYSLSASRNPISNSGIVSATTQINYVKNGDSSVAVNGSIYGSITGEKVSKDMFSVADATKLAFNSIEKSKSAYEENIYGALINGPSSYGYTVQEDANRIDFSFQFKNPFDTKNSEVLHDYTSSASASKDNNSMTASINGTLTYDSSFDVFSGGAVENSQRYQKISEEFSGLNFYGLALEAFSNLGGDYDPSSYLNPVPVSESVTKDPHAPSISYSYSYDNTQNEQGLKNLNIQINDTKPASRGQIIETNTGFAKTSSKYLGRIEGTASCDEDSSKLPELRLLLSGVKGCHKFLESTTLGDKSISYSISYYY